MKIISGQAGGIRLCVPRGTAVRPTLGRARAALFDSLAPWNGRLVVDLFAGSGALGLEAASRGAAEVHFIENHPGHLSTIGKNIEAVRKSGVSAVCEIRRKDACLAHLALAQVAGRVDIIFADPPYAKFADCAENILLDHDFASWAANALFVWEIPEKQNCMIPPAKSPWKILKRRRFASTEFIILNRKP